MAPEAPPKSSLANKNFVPVRVQTVDVHLFTFSTCFRVFVYLCLMVVYIFLTCCSTVLANAACDTVTAERDYDHVYDDARDTNKRHNVDMLGNRN